MSTIKRLLRRLRSPKLTAQTRLQGVQVDMLLRAHGDWIALLATILEREQVISGNELARSLSEYATVTEVDRPEEGRILAFWAARLQETAASLKDFPSIH